jgi:glycosyltransferase involved in cell wall biosynthesis
MSNLRVLHIGIKNWPYHAEFEESSNLKRGGGANKYSYLLINAYSDNIQSHIITQLAKNQEKTENEKGICLYRLKSFGGRKLKQIVFNLKSFFFAYKLIKKKEIQLIHGHMLIGIFFSVILGKIHKIPVVGTPYSVYTTEFGFPLINIARFLEKNIYKLLNIIVFESEENKVKSLKILETEFKNAIFITTGIESPIEKSQNFPLEYYKNNKIKILFVGRLVNIKALDRLINGISLLSDYHKTKIEVNIIGEGEEFIKLKELIENKKLNNVVFLRGFVSDIKGFLLNSDIFILPSFMEGLSIALLEAMSYGLACIINDFSFPHENLLFVMKNNEERTICESLTYFIEQPDKINFYKNNSLKLIERKFSIEVFSNGYVDTYKSLI